MPRALFLFASTIALTLVAWTNAARAAEPGLTADLAQKLASACIAYARDHNGAVNIWIYNSNGELLHLERMDGAPPMPPLQEFELRDGFGLDPNREIAGGVSIRLNGRIVGTAKAAGMGPAGDLACALAAVKAAQ
ncbi:MAG TPA: heme-binding protein [Micropepsaceae bacterium]|nr:heme-binding protein [Micropepsaceae bacterium]